MRSVVPNKASMLQLFCFSKFCIIFFLLQYSPLYWVKGMELQTIRISSFFNSLSSLPFKLILQNRFFSTNFLLTDVGARVFTEPGSVNSPLLHRNQVGGCRRQEQRINSQRVYMMIHTEQEQSIYSSLSSFKLIDYLLREKKTPDLRASSFNQEASLSIST